jgi:biotin carboxyl carrier protein
MKATHTVLRGIAPVVAKAPLMSGTRIHTRQYHFGSVLQLAKIVENVPALGESITEGTIAKWMKNVGDQVNIDDVIAVVETDKVTVDIKSTNAGVLTQQLAQDNVSR